MQHKDANSDPPALEGRKAQDTRVMSQKGTQPR